MVYEYWVVPAPRRGQKARGLRSAEDRFAFALTNLMNTMGAQGWEYQRADALPCDERSGLMGTKTTFQNVLVFRRPLEVSEEETLSAPQEEVSLPPPPRPPAPPPPPPPPPTISSPAPRTAKPEPLAVAAPVLGAAVQPLGVAPALGPATSAD